MNARLEGVETQTSGVRGRPSKVRLALAFGLGVIAATSALVFGIPGNGEFIAFTWLAGLLAAFIAPGIPGFIAVVAGVTVWAALLDMADGTFGLVFLVIAIVGALAAHGELVGSVLRRIGTLGWREGLRDRTVVVRGWIAVALAALFVWSAIELGKNPP